MGDVVLCTVGVVVAVVVVPATAVVGETTTEVDVVDAGTVVELVELVELLGAGLLVDVVVAPAVEVVVPPATVVDVVDVVVASKPVPQAVNCASKSSFTLPANTWPYDWVSLPRSSCPLPTQKRP